MAVVSRVATIKINSTALGDAGGFRQWQATAATQDTAEGSSVVVTIAQTSGGTTPPSAADTLTLNYYDDASGLVKTVSLTPGSASQTDSFFFTANGLSGGGNRHGTIEIALRATKTTGGPTATYDVETDGSPNTPPSTFSTATLDRGWIRGTTTATLSVSNVGSGVAANPPASFPDSLFVRATLGSASYVARAQTLTLSEGATAKRTGSSNSTTGTNWDATFSGTSLTTGRVNDGLSASSHTLTSSIGLGNATLTGQPYTVLTATTAGTIVCDPRRYRRPLFQLDDNSFGTPPTSKDVATHRRSNLQQGFLATQFLNARSEGQNGITFDETLVPVKPGTAVSRTGQVTATAGGQAGYSPSFMAWGSGLPGGVWNKTDTVTGPTDATDAAHTILFAGSMDAYTLIARNPDYEARVNVNHIAALAGRHFTAGMSFAVVAYLVDLSTQKRVDASLITSVVCTLVRPSPADSSGLSNTFQFFDGTAWQNWTSGTPQTTFVMTASPTDPQTYERQFTDTSTFGLRDFRASAQIVSDSSTYSSSLVTINVGPHHPHDVQGLEWAGVAP